MAPPPSTLSLIHILPQVTRIAMRLREQGLAIDPAVYTVEALERELLALRRGETGC